MTLAAEVRHPAKFSVEVIDGMTKFIHDEHERKGHQLSILDPFAGVGGIHIFNKLGHLTYGVEMEPEWARSRPGTIVGDATSLPFKSGTMDVIATSPCYGNRMADHHDAQERCRPCKGTGFLGQGEETEYCQACEGEGRREYQRNTYKHALGRDLKPGNSGAMQWGEPYRRLHLRAWREAARVLHRDGLFLLNISNHIRSGKEQLVSEWHLDVMLALGFRMQEVTRIFTSRLRQGQNYDLRCENEFIMAFRSPA